MVVEGLLKGSEFVLNQGSATTESHTKLNFVPNRTLIIASLSSVLKARGGLFLEIRIFLHW